MIPTTLKRSRQCQAPRTPHIKRLSFLEEKLGRTFRMNRSSRLTLHRKHSMNPGMPQEVEQRILIPNLDPINLTLTPTGQDRLWTLSTLEDSAYRIQSQIKVHKGRVRTPLTDMAKATTIDPGIEVATRVVAKANPATCTIPGIDTQSNEMFSVMSSTMELAGVS